MSTEFSLEKITSFLNENSLEDNVYVQRCLAKEKIFTEYTSPLKISKDIYFSLLECYRINFNEEMSADFALTTSLLIINKSMREMPLVGLYHSCLSSIEEELKTMSK
jgi:hypothetical protein